MLLGISSFFVTRIESEGEISYNLTTLGYSSLILVIVALLLTAAIFFGKSEKKFHAKQLVFCSVAIALSVITSMIKLYDFPFGGSITLLSMLFVCLIGYWYGPKVGLLTGFSCGLLQLVVDPYILFPLQVLVDYPLAFGALGLSGFFWKSKHGLIKGYLAGILGRYFFSTLSGWIFFGMYAWEGWSPLVYSLVYNGAYIFAEGAITLIIISLPSVKKALDYVKRQA